MPRASKMTDQPGEKVFYFPEIGAVQCKTMNGLVVEARPVEDGASLYSWEAGKGSFIDDEALGPIPLDTYRKLAADKALPPGPGSK
jgi:hypothetical protein